MDQLQGKTRRRANAAPADMDLPGFRSHVRYSVFKDRVAFRAPPRGAAQTRRTPPAGREAVGELSLELQRCQPSVAEVGAVPAARAI
jgi:hypothetical protein